MLARSVSNLLQAFSCVPRVAPIMEMDSGFSEVPVWVDRSVQFVDVETLVLKVHGVQISTDGETARRRNRRCSHL